MTSPLGDAVVHVRGTTFTHESRRGGFELRIQSLEIRSGEVTVVYGPNGCGKTTLFRLLAGVLRPENGSVTWTRGGVPIRPRLGEDLVLTTGAGPFPHMTVERNLALPLTRNPDAGRVVREVAEKWGLTDLLHRRAHELSAGQAQRVVLARALALAAPIYLFDEIASAQSESWAVSVGDELATQARCGRFVLAISHDPAWVLRHADRVIALDAVDSGEDGSSAVVYPCSTVRYDGTPSGWLQSRKIEPGA